MKSPWSMLGKCNRAQARNKCGQHYSCVTTRGSTAAGAESLPNRLFRKTRGRHLRRELRWSERHSGARPQGIIGIRFVLSDKAFARFALACRYQFRRARLARL